MRTEEKKIQEYVVAINMCNDKQAEKGEGTFKRSVCYLMEVEDQIQLTDIAKVTVKDFHKMMDNFEGDKFVIVLVYGAYKVQGSVPSCDL